MADDSAGSYFGDGPGDGSAARDLSARIRDLQQEIAQAAPHGVTQAQLEQSVRSAVADLLPGAVAAAVSDAVGASVPGAVAGALPGVVTDALAGSLPALVADSVESSIDRAMGRGGQPAGDGEQLEPRLAALEDALGGVGERLEALTRDGAAATTSSLEELRHSLDGLVEDVRADHGIDSARAEIDALRVDLANALEYVRETVTARFEEELGHTREAVAEVALSLGRMEPPPAADGTAAMLEPRFAELERSMSGRLDQLADQLASTTRPTAPETDLAAGLDAVHERLGGLDLVQQRIDGIEAGQHRLTELVDRPAGDRDLTALMSRLDALDSAVAARDRDTGVHDRLDAIHDRLDLVAADVVRLDPDTLVGAVLELRTDLATTTAESLAATEGVGTTLAEAIREQRVGEAERTSRAAGDALQREAATISSTVSEAVSAAVSAAVTEAVTEGVTEGVLDGVLAGLAPQLAGTAESGDALAAHLAEHVAEHVSAHVSEHVSQQVSDQLSAELAGPLPDRLADHLADRLADRLAAGLAGQLAGPVSDSDVAALLAEVAAQVDVVAGRVEGAATTGDVDAVRVALADLADLAGPGDVLGREIDALRADLANALDFVRDTVGSQASAGTDGLLTAVLELRTDLATTTAESLSALARLAEVGAPLVDAEPDRAGRGATDEQITGQLAALLAAQDEAAVRLGELSDAQAGGSEQLATLLGQVSTGLDERLATQQGMVDDLTAAHADLHDRIAAWQQPDPAETAALLRGDLDLLADRVAVTDDRIEEVRLRSAELLVSSSSLLASLDRQAASLDALSARLGDQGGLAGVVGEIGSVGARVDALSAQLDGVAAAQESGRAAQAASVEQLDAVRADLAGVTEGVAERVRESAGVLETASLESLAQVRLDTEEAVATLRHEVEAARSALSEHARELQAAVGEQTAAATAAALADVRAAVTAEAAELGGARVDIAAVGARVEAAGRLLVGYLGERDVRLEQVRDEVTVQLLTDVLDGLSRKDREKAAEQTRGLLGRRRDARDAERFRQEHAGVTAPDLPGGGDEAALLALLDAAAPEAGGPGAPAAASDAPAAATPAAAGRTPARTPVTTPPRSPATVAPQVPSTGRATAPARAAAKAPVKLPAKAARKSTSKSTNRSTSRSTSRSTVKLSAAAPATTAAKSAVKLPTKAAAKAPMKALIKVPVKVPAKVLPTAPTTAAGTAPSKAAGRAAATAPSKAAATPGAKAPTKNSAATTTPPPTPPAPARRRAQATRPRGR